MSGRSLPNPNDLLLAIRRKCLDCMCNHSKLVKGCTSKDCPLHPYRSVDALPAAPDENPAQVTGQLSMIP